MRNCQLVESKFNENLFSSQADVFLKLHELTAKAVFLLIEHVKCDCATAPVRLKIPIPILSQKNSFSERTALYCL